MSQARNLLEEPRNSLTQLLGHILSAENTVAEYRKHLVEDANLLRSHRGLEALATAVNSAMPKTLSLRDVEDAGALSEALKLVKSRVHENTVAGEKVLGSTGVSFDRWCEIVVALDAGRNPALETQEAEALVGRGLVERTYRLGART